jgi:hypothetical protein
MHNFPFPQQNSANQSGFSEDMSSEAGFRAKPAKKQNPELHVNVILNVAIPLPLGTEIDASKRDILKCTIHSEIILSGVSLIGLSLDSSCIQLQVKFPAHLTLERLLRSILTRVSYTLHLLTGKPVFLSGSAIVSTEATTADEISALTS